MVKPHELRSAILLVMVAFLTQAAGTPGCAAPARSAAAAFRGDETDRKLRRIQQGLDLTQVSREALWTALTSEKAGGTDYLTVAGDVVTAVQVAKKVHDGKYVDAVTKAGSWGSKTALSLIGLSGVATVWTATELAMDGTLYLVDRFDEKIIDGIIAAYVIRRSRAGSDEDAWADTRDYPPNLVHGWPVANGPFATDEERQRAQQDLDNRIHEQCRAAWQIYQAYTATEGDRARFRSTVLDLVAAYGLQNTSASLGSSNGDATALISRDVADFSLVFEVDVRRREGSVFFRLSRDPGTGEYGLKVDGRDGYGLIFCPFAGQGANPGVYVVVRQGGVERTLSYSGDGFPRSSGKARFALTVRGDDITVFENGRRLLHARDQTFSSGRLVWRIYGDPAQHASAGFRIVSYTPAARAVHGL